MSFSPPKPYHTSEDPAATFYGKIPPKSTKRWYGIEMILWLSGAMAIMAWSFAIIKVVLSTLDIFISK